MLNVISVIGRFVADPELKITNSGKDVTSFTIANDQGKDRPANFIDCVAWEKSAELITKYFHKGDLIGITGKLTTRTYETDGGKRKATEVVVNDVTFCTNKSESTATAAGAESVDDEDLPF